MPYAQNTLAARKNYNAIDAAKLVCSILVVMIHIPPLGRNLHGAIWYVGYGIQSWLARISVPFFFVCSGFFLYKKTSLKNFSFEPTKKYALRLLRLYLIWSALYLPLSFQNFLKGKVAFDEALMNYISNFIFNGSYTHLWYLPANIIAVLIVSFLLKKKINPEVIIIAALILYIAGLFTQSWFGFIEPLRDAAPSLWSFLSSVEDIIKTARNGLFDGFLFVGIGMLFAFYRFPISKRKALAGFIISMLLMGVEAFFLREIGFVKNRDMYLFLVPSAFFAFSYISRVELSDSPAYKTMRSMSSMIFYSHYWVRFVVASVLYRINKALTETSLQFILTVVGTVIFSFVVIKLSEFKKLKFLRVLYT